MATFDFIKNSHHKFFKLQENELIVAEERLGFAFPNELRSFYLEVGYGFIKGNNVDAINRIMDPDTIADITLREGIYEFDPDLEGIYEEEDKLVFYEINEGVYLTLDLNTPQQTPVYFFETQIADSLEEFIRKINQDTEYFVDMVD
ncbi:TPA: SMI1/KNR4 family protein [Bacillus cereus]|uniref:SMI1/KNR4 family protein n=2 Tax=Bacillus cereus group TaxID=86661 RepID=A0A2A8ZQQ2_BACCE|nr:MULTISPECIES: SMI1/KNR4 family protein [Bacillus]MCP1181438.1 SMI1/KNR4 family protein [Bacillus sp. 1663tsa1]MCP1282216.1 SMI1/KNR4 family protein [Bacillus sp. S0635]MCQ6346210.1 SMI1/KNR4 family protein [Bacillus cereus]MCU5098324.1 SMI1/KNR4 family protein [Bacillus wiedmannii]MCU5462920.1 SMI1/KNR4 family protein [Bacillus cereus]